MTGEMRRFAGIPALLLAASAAGCGGEWSARSDNSSDGSSSTTGGVVVAHRRLVLEPAPADRLPTTLPGSEVVLRFSAPLDADSARGAATVEDPSRGPVPVEAEVRGRELVLRPRAGGSWRPGGTLRVRVAGLPSLNSLRSADGDPLDRDATVEVTVRSPRRTDRTPPVLLSSDPPAGAAAVDPEAPVVLRFSEPMDPRALNQEGRGSPFDAVILEADGRVIPFHGFLDRTRTELTLLPMGGLPPWAEVRVDLGARVRDAGGNPLDLASPREILFTTGAAGTGGLLVEAFEDEGNLDPFGTTVRWNHPADSGVLSPVMEPRTFEAAPAGEIRSLRLDPRGGTLLLVVPCTDLGDEPRILTALHLVAAAGTAGGEILEPRLRVAAGPALRLWEGVDPAAWRPAAELPSAGLARGGVVPLPFRHPVRHDGASDLALELTWSGTTGTVNLRAVRCEELGVFVLGPGPEAAGFRLCPVVRLEGVGTRAVARSRWLDSGAETPSWLPPVPLPRAPGTVVRLQGAPSDGRGLPDAAAATEWTEDPAALLGMRWIRFRVLFDPGARPEAALDRLDLPFVAK